VGDNSIPGAEKREEKQAGRGERKIERRRRVQRPLESQKLGGKNIMRIPPQIQTKLLKKSKNEPKRPLSLRLGDCQKREIAR